MMWCYLRHQAWATTNRVEWHAWAACVKKRNDMWETLELATVDGIQAQYLGVVDCSGEV
jgi:hypothetical protein